MVQKCSSQNPAILKSHLDQTQKNELSTKFNPFWVPTDMLDNKMFVYASVVHIENCKIYDDQTGKFRVTSGIGKKYIIVL